MSMVQKCSHQIQSQQIIIIDGSDVDTNKQQTSKKYVIDPTEHVADLKADRMDLISTDQIGHEQKCTDLKADRQFEQKLQQSPLVIMLTPQPRQTDQ